MARKRHTSEEIVAKLRQVDVRTSQGRPVAEAVRAIGVTEVTCYRWRSEHGGLKGDRVKRLRQLEAENTRLRRAVSDLTLDKMILGGGGAGKLPSPARRRAWVEHVVTELGVPERRACRVLGPWERRSQALQAAQTAEQARGRGGADGRHRRARHPLRLPPDHGAASGRRLGGQPQAGRAALAAGGAQGACQAAQARPAVAQRRLLHPAAAGTPEPRLVLRLRRGPYPWPAAGGPSIRAAAAVC